MPIHPKHIDLNSEDCWSFFLDINKSRIKDAKAAVLKENDLTLQNSYILRRRIFK
jgi:hypothetical protein